MTNNKRGKRLLTKEREGQSHHCLQKLCWEMSADALSPFGDVLEIGFEGAPFSNYVQTYFPKSHTIIESRPSLQRRAKQWAVDHIDVAIRKKMPMKLGHEKFDAIFFNNLSDVLSTESKEEGIGTSHARASISSLPVVAYTLRECLYHHMREGAGFSFFVQANIDLWEHPLFSKVFFDCPVVDCSERLLVGDELLEGKKLCVGVKLVKIVRQL